MENEKFEVLLNRLKEIVGKLENEEADLDESVKLYEEGLELSKKLHSILGVYDSKIADIAKGESHE